MNYQIQTLNAISPAIYTQLGEHYHVSDSAGQPDAILVRSASMHDMPLAPSVLSIARAGAGEPIPFEEAFDQLRHCYMENERTNRVRHASGYQRVVQITIIGRGAGTFTIRFNENGMQVEPTSASDAEAYVHCSFDNLLAMARGFVTVDKLYLSGQLRLSGNLSKGFEIRYLLSPAKQRA